MMIPYKVFWILSIGTLVVAIGALYFGHHVRRARMVERIGLVGGLAALLSFAIMYFAASKVYVFTGEGGHVEREKYLLFGSTSHGGIDVTADGDGTIIVNHTDRTLRVRTVYYGTQKYAALTGPNAARRIEPGTALSYDHDLDNFGPTDPPPSSMSSKQSFDSRTHITW